MEKTIKEKYIFKGKIINLRVDEVILPNDKTTYREVVEHRGGVGVLAIDGDDVFLVKQYRYPYHQFLYEIPAGKLEVNESPIETGIRELQEETGIYSKTLVSLGKIYPSPGYTNEVIHLYYTTDINLSSASLDDDEFLEVEKVNLKKAYALINEGKIVDAKTIIALLKYKELHKGER